MAYSVDLPRSSMDEGEDLALDTGRVTAADRELLRADEEVVNELNSKSSLFGGFKAGDKLRSIFNGSGGSGGKKKKEGRKVKFGDYVELGDESTSGSAMNMSPLYAGRSKSRRPSDADSELDSEGDEIEIDLESAFTRRRRGHSAGSSFKRLHVFFFVAAVLAALLFFSNIFSGPADGNGDSDKTAAPGIPHKRQFNNGTHNFYSTTIVISLDGFHPHYLSAEVSPHLNELYTQHAAAAYMQPSFPTSTFPNHWTLATGLYPRNHGIVGNTFYDPVQGPFVNTNPAISLQSKWWGGQPVWQTASYQGVQPAVHMWPGSEVPWEMQTSFEVDKFNGAEALESKTARICEWLDRASINDRPELIMTYVPTVDTIGHKDGISGDELKDAIATVDSFVGSVVHQLDTRNLTQFVNLIVVSDHGMAPTSTDRLVFFEDIMDMSKVDRVDGWPLVAIRPKTSRDLLLLYRELQKNQPKEGGWTVYLEKDMPKEWQFGGMGGTFEKRLAPLWIVPEVGWTVISKDQHDAPGSPYMPKGVHGYDNRDTLMRSIFLAQGPYFELDVTDPSSHVFYEPFPNVDVYNVVCDTLGLHPASNDGELPNRVLKPLSPSWRDPQDYPGVSFAAEILSINSTYDMLFRTGRDDDKATPTTLLSVTKPSATSPSTSSPTPSSSSAPDSSNKLQDWYNRWKDWFKSWFGGGNDKEDDEHDDEDEKDD